ncbi:hypothetical protein C0Q66_08485 [Streptomyces albidoflavus]|nr:hypothetical protein C0Q66_08485 [Streptomyces albidoflavus]
MWLRRGWGVAAPRLGCGCATAWLWLRRGWGCQLLPVPVTGWPQSPAGLGGGCAATGGAGRCPCPVTDWPQAPAGLGCGVAELRPCVPARDPAGHRWPQSPAGL